MHSGSLTGGHGGEAPFCGPLSKTTLLMARPFRHHLCNSSRLDLVDLRRRTLPFVLCSLVTKLLLFHQLDNTRGPLTSP